MSICVSICLSVCLSTSLFAEYVYRSVNMPMCLPIRLSIFWSAYLSVYLTMCLSTCLSICLYVYRPAWIFQFVSVGLYACMYFCRAISIFIFPPVFSFICMSICLCDVLSDRLRDCSTLSGYCLYVRIPATPLRTSLQADSDRANIKSCSGIAIKLPCIENRCAICVQKSAPFWGLSSRASRKDTFIFNLDPITIF